MNEPGEALAASATVSRTHGALIAAVLILAFAALFWEVIFQDRTFVFRDAGHFYYPYHKLVASEYLAGRVPLWNPYENCGEPLAASPTACAFYPAQILHIMLPYAVGFKWYLLGHVIFAWIATYLAGRMFALSPVASILAATSYALSSFVIFQIYNTVFLCGAAWLPLGLAFVHQLVNQPRVVGALGLAVVLSMEVLSGDPQVAYLTVLVAVPYLLYICFPDRFATILLFSFWSIGCGVVQRGQWLPDWPETAPGIDKLPFWQRAVNSAIDAWSMIAEVPGNLQSFFFKSWLYCLLGTAGALVGFVVLVINRKRILSNRQFTKGSAALVLACILALGLSAIQIFPTMEFVLHSDRAAAVSPHTTMPFSLFPARIAEFFAPHVFGKQMPINTRWAPFEKLETGIWLPNLYMGLLPVLLLISLVLIETPSRVSRLLLWLMVVSVWLAIGKFGGIWWLLDIKNVLNPPKVIDLNRDTTDALYGRPDGLYGLFEGTLPGFRSFRYPSKMLVFTVFALAMLGGVSFDRLDANRLGRVLLPLTRRLALGGLVLGIGIVALRPAVVPILDRLNESASPFGPQDAVGSWYDLSLAIFHCAIVSGIIGSVLTRTEGRSPWRGVFLTLVLALDLLVSGRTLIFSDEQAAVDARPLVSEIIEKNEAKEREQNPGAAPQPFRIHRTKMYSLLPWFETGSRRRMEDMSRWERTTVQPKYGLSWNIHYSTTVGTMSIYDVEFFFAPWVEEFPSDFLARNPSIPKRVVYYPREGFNLWNTKYFVLPRIPVYADQERGIFTFLRTAEGAPCPKLFESEEMDLQILVNPEAFPRAWVVHRADFRTEIHDLERTSRTDRMEELLFRPRDAGISLWDSPTRTPYPLKSRVMLETNNPAPVARYQSGKDPEESETVEIQEYGTQTLRAKATLTSPGFVVIAETYYSGWSATVNGRETPLLRANRAMRAVPCDAGENIIEMRYRSRPFEIGLVISAVSWLILAPSLAIFALRRRRN